MNVRSAIGNSVYRAAVIGHLAALLMLMSVASARAGVDVHAVEARIKAAYLYHFCNYVDWPKDAFAREDSPLVIGVIGSDRMVSELREVVMNRVAHGRQIMIREIRSGDSLDDLHLLFVAEAAITKLRQLVTASEQRSMLVVTEDPAGFNRNGAINFIIENDKVRFDIAPQAVRQRNLTVSAQLLTVARTVIQEDIE